MAARRAHPEAHQPRQGPVPRPPRQGSGAHQARPHPPPRHHGAGDAAVPRRSAGQPPPLPRRRERDRLLAEGRPQARPRLAHPVALRRPRQGRDGVVPGPRLRGGAGVGGQQRRRRAAPVDLAWRVPARAHLGDDRHRPRHQGHLRGRPRARPPLPHGARPPRRAGPPQGDGQARHPDLGARGRRLHLRGDPGLGGDRLARRRRHRARAGELGVDEGQATAASPASTTRRTRSTRRSSRPFSARPVPGAPVSVPITWDELDDPELRPDGWTIRTIGERLATAGDPLAPLVGVQQRLPSL